MVGIHPKNMCVFIVFVATLIRFTREHSSVFVCVSLCVVCVCVLEYGIEIVHFVNRARPNTTPSKCDLYSFFCVVLVVECFVLFSYFISSIKNLEKWYPRLEAIRNSYVITNRRLFLLKLKKEEETITKRLKIDFFLLKSVKVLDPTKFICKYIENITIYCIAFLLLFLIFFFFVWFHSVSGRVWFN